MRAGVITLVLLCMIVNAVAETSDASAGQNWRVGVSGLGGFCLGVVVRELCKLVKKCSCRMREDVEVEGGTRHRSIHVGVSAM